MPASKSAATPLSAFHEAVAAQVARIEAEREAGSSNVASRLDQFGIQATVRASSTDGPFKVTIKPNENAGLPHGVKRSQLNPEALAELDAKHLAAEKERVWQRFRYLSTRGYYSTEQATTALTALGFTTLPSAKTSVQYSQEGNGVDRYGDRRLETISFELDGEVSEADVKARLEAVLKPEGLHAVIAEAFPEAEKLPSVVRDLYVSTKQSWPNYSEFHTSE